MDFFVLVVATFGFLFILFFVDNCITKRQDKRREDEDKDYFSSPGKRS